MSGLRVIVTLFAILGWLGCASPPGDAAGSGAAAGRAKSPLIGAVDGLALSFVDPETYESVAARGPFSILRADADALELEGFDHTYQKARVRLFVHDGQLWAKATVQGREFLTLLH